MSRRWLVLRISAPLMAFGAVAVDQVGPSWRWPGRSMLTGLFANALGWHWTDRTEHQALQDRLIVAAASIRPGEILTDTQNAMLSKSDRGWTTHGEPEGRAGASYDAPHRRRRDYIADGEIAVVVTLETAEMRPTLEDLNAALLRPVRPIYVGRKPCLPSRPLVGDPAAPGFIEAENAHAALQLVVAKNDAVAWWPDDQGPEGSRSYDVADLRNWDSGLHGGTRRIREGRL